MLRIILMLTQQLWYFCPQYLTNGNFSLLTISFCEGTQKDLSGALDYFANIVSNLLLSSAENTKNEPFLMF